MKKLLVGIMLLIFGLSFGENDSISKPTISDAERIIDKYGGKIIDGFETITSKITPVATKGFEVAVKLNIAHGIGCLIPLFLFLIFLYSLKNEYFRIDNILKSDNVPDNLNYRRGPLHEDNCSLFLVLYIVATVLCFILSLIFTVDGIKHLLAPEWFAIKDIIDLFK